LERPCILVVEEQRELASIVMGMRDTVGFEITAVSTIAHLRKALVEHSFDFIMIDLYMPESDRFELIIDLADIRCQSPIIFTSGQGGMLLDVAGKIARTQGLNLIGLLDRPVQPEDLRLLLQKSAA